MIKINPNGPPRIKNGKIYENVSVKLVCVPVKNTISMCIFKILQGVKPPNKMFEEIFISMKNFISE